VYVYTMGCDYYITKVLRIYFGDHYLSFVIERENGYYFSIYDEDEEDYETKIEEYIKECLTPKMEPIIIYDNKFNKTYETKYKSFVEDLLKDCGKHFSDVTKIIKVEVRYDR